MKTFLIGHRGVGKTSLLQRMRLYHRGDVPCIDLDDEVVKEEGRDLFFLFREKGEDYFRQRELEVFHRICNSNDKVVVSLGAGFKLDRAYFPKGANCLWVMRDTDLDGRIFVDRPRLNPALNQLEEYRKRFEEREVLFQRFANQYYILPEGIRETDRFERDLMLGNAYGGGGILTVTQKILESWTSMIRPFSHWVFDAIELRDDLLTDEEIEDILPQIPREKVLLSFRRPGSNALFEDLVQTGYSFDWPMEKGKCPFPAQYKGILSSHFQDIPQWSDNVSHLKWSPLVETWDELQKGLVWQQEEAEKRSFLPRSKRGQWAWVRLWLKGRQKLNFLRIGRSAVSDQPTPYEWLATPARSTKFAAILGHPVHFSWSPLEHQKFFLQRGMPFFRIDVEEAQTEVALRILSRLGLVAAAVTSPLKNWAFGVCKVKDERTEKLKMVNTLALAQGQWNGTNTDIDGFREMFEEIQQPGEIAVWGGGGTLPVIQQIVGKADYYSVRTGSLRGSAEVDLNKSNPNTVIWAAGPEADVPVQDWAPLRVMDLNYRENSLARQYALSVKCHYISGARMFLAQAKKQQEFWETIL